MLRQMWDSLKESSFSEIILLIGLAIIGYLCALTLHKLFLRLKKYYFKDSNFNFWIPSIILAVLVLPYRLPFSIVIIHFAAIFLIIDLITSVLRKIAGKELKLLHSGVVSLILSTIVCVYGSLNFIVVVPHEYIVETDRVDKEYNIVFITDIHGPIIPMSLFKKYTSDINKLNADFIILGGDITDEFTPRKRMEETYKTLGEISNKDGIYYMYGNHDRLKYGNRKDYDRDILNEAITSSGITILKDKHVIIDNKITLIGRDDSGSEGKDRLNMDQLHDSVNPNSFVIVAEHEPSYYNDIARHGVDLYLYGHTHAGQIFPIGFYFRTFWNAFNTGRHKYNDLDIIISSGFGAWAFPFRTEYHSEYVIIKLEKKKK